MDKNIDMSGGTQAKALYVHVPFCGSKCAYCAFSSHVPAPARRHREVQEWLAALGAEAAWRLGPAGTGARYSLGKRKPEFTTVFVGGGTPTFLSASELAALLDILGDYGLAVPAAEREVTVEANPDSLTAAKADILRRRGVNRVSLGVQSLDDNLLRALGRRHRRAEVRHAVTVLRGSGLTNINFDLMFGLPGQDMNTWRRTVKEAVAMNPEHLSLYGLSVEPGTPLARRFKYVSASGPAGAVESAGSQDINEVAGSCGFPPLPDGDAQADMYEWAVDFLAEQGYERYETSNFARKGFTCRHNEAVWRGEDYVGMGPSAVSTQGRIRRTNTSELKAYVEGVKQTVGGADSFILKNREGDTAVFSFVETLTKRQQMSEYMILGLRTAQGVSFSAFYRRFGVALEDIFGQVLAKYSQDRVLAIKAGRVFFYPQYFFVANAVLHHFILEG